MAPVILLIPGSSRRAAASWYLPGDLKHLVEENVGGESVAAKKPVALYSNRNKLLPLFEDGLCHFNK